MGLSYLSNQCWIPDSTDSDWMDQQSLELPQELELDLDHLFSFQDDFTLADTSFDPLFFSPPQTQPTFISQSQTPQLPATYHFDQLQQDFQQHQEQQFYYSNSKRQRTTKYSNSNLHAEDMLLPCTNTDPFFGSQVVNQSTDEAWQLHDVTFPPVFDCGSVTSNNSSYRSGREGGGGLSAQSIAARQRRRKIADKTHELGKLIPGGHKMNTAEMFRSASMYVKFLQAQIAILTLTNNSLQEGRTSCDEEKQHLKLLVESPMVQEKLYSNEKCLAPQKLVESLLKDSKLLSDHPSLAQYINNLSMTAHAQSRH